MRTGIAPARGPSSPTIGSLSTGTVTPTPHDFREALSSPALANVKSKSVTQEGPLGQREAQDSVSGHLSHPPPQAPRPGPRGWGRHLQPTEKTLLPGKATPEPPLDFRNHPPSPGSKAGHALPRPPGRNAGGRRGQAALLQTLLGVFLDASRCLPVHLEGRPGHRLQSCPGKAGKEQEKLIITISVITIFDEKTLAHDSITGAASPGAPVPSAVTPPAYGAERTSLGWSSPLHTHPVPSRPRRD